MKEKHCDKCSYMTEEGLAVTGCAYCGCHNKMKTEQIKEEWDNFARRKSVIHINSPEREIEFQELTDFWIQKLEQQKQEMVKEIEGLDRYDPMECSPIHKTVTDGILTICHNCSYNGGYNQALDTVIKVIKE